MNRPMFAANKTLASGSTYAGHFALLLFLFLLQSGIFQDAQLTALACLANLHSRTAGWPLVGLRLVLAFDPSVWLSNTTSPAKLIHPSTSAFNDSAVGRRMIQFATKPLS